MQPLLSTAATLLACLPASSDAKVAGAIRRFREAMTFWALSEPSEQAVLAYVVARCCPPVDTELPDCCKKPVLPQTAAGDIDALRRAAAINIDNMRMHADALNAPSVSELLRSIGGRMKRLKTCKRALLYAEVEAQWKRASSSNNTDEIIDAFAVVLAFFFGMRISELLSLTPEQIEAIDLSDGNHAMRVTFYKVKNRQSILQSHDPFRVACAHPLLIESWSRFEEVTDYYENVPLFHSGHGSDISPRTRHWFTTIIKRIAPDAVPHSCRVGLATELWAAGCRVEEIMTAGRWTSAAAVLYVIGSLEDQVSATRKVGTGLVYTGADLRRLGASPDEFRPEHRPTAPHAQWHAIARSVETATE